MSMIIRGVDHKSINDRRRHCDVCATQQSDIVIETWFIHYYLCKNCFIMLGDSITAFKEENNIV